MEWIKVLRSFNAATSQLCVDLTTVLHNLILVLITITNYLSLPKDNPISRIAGANQNFLRAPADDLSHTWTKQRCNLRQEGGCTLTVDRYRRTYTGRMCGRAKFCAKTTHSSSFMTDRINNRWLCQWRQEDASRLRWWQVLEPKSKEHR